MGAFVASELLRESVERHGIHLSLLVADTGLWANPAVHQRLIADTGCAAFSPRVRRAKVGEEPGDVVEGVRLDNNTYANVAIKRALGLNRKHVEGFEACHIWPLTCYDTRYHTAPANIVLLPRALAGLSDHDHEIQAALQYRAAELYSWWPDGFEEPLRPSFYPDCWREPLPDIARRAKKAPRGTHQSSSASGPLPITLEPEDPAAFKTMLLGSHRAEIHVIFTDGTVEVWPWSASRFTESSNVAGNLRSRSEFRQGEWQRRGIVRVLVRALADGG